MGTRMARPLSLPFSSGKMVAIAVADPVEVGARLSMPERHRLRSCHGGVGVGCQQHENTGKEVVRACVVFTFKQLFLPNDISTPSKYEAKNERCRSTEKLAAWSDQILPGDVIRASDGFIFRDSRACNQSRRRLRILLRGAASF